ncbi:FUSC family protein [Phytohalomonas tamaricis]|uniref:FUSC family protein n=1 Tax=Phytohalomonas tamaricis TaxID=2081032 RepID=UPI000D0AC8D9|nr:FUSC family protein [Phytohalomonas tamaricis]
MIALPPLRDWLFSLKTFSASMTALYIALHLQMPRPYWAMATVYIVSSPFVGATSSKALYRALGTCLGASAAVFFVPLFVDTPLVLSAIIAIWTGTLLFLSLHVRTARSYALMLAGYTLPMIAYSTINTPEGIFEVAVSRSEEIVLGIVCASIVGSVVLPTRLTPVLVQSIDKWFDDASAYCAQFIARRADSVSVATLRSAMVGTVNSLQLMISQVPYEGMRPQTVKQIRELRGRMAQLLPVVDALDDILTALERRAPEQARRLAPLLGELEPWIESSSAQPSLASWQHLHHALEHLEPSTEELAQPAQALLSSALWRLREWIDLWQDCRTLRAAIAAERDVKWTPVYRHWRLGISRRYFDRPLMIYSVLTTILGIFIASLIWIETGWHDGGSAVVLAAVACSFFAAMDEPAPQIFRFFTWTIVSVMLSSIYLFAILPNIHDFPLLVLAFAGPFIAIGTLITQPRFYLPTLLTIVQTATFVGIQDVYKADFLTFINSNLVGIAGLLFAFIWTLISRPYGAELAARRMTHASWRDIAATTAAEPLADRRGMAGRMLDRFMQHLPRLAISGQDTAPAVRELRVALNALDLRIWQQRLPDDQHQVVTAALAAVHMHFSACLKAGRPLATPHAVFHRIDAALALITHSTPASAGLHVMHALIGLRLALQSGEAIIADPAVDDPSLSPAGIDGAPL